MSDTTTQTATLSKKDAVALIEARDAAAASRLMEDEKDGIAVDLKEEAVQRFLIAGMKVLSRFIEKTLYKLEP